MLYRIILAGAIMLVLVPPFNSVPSSYRLQVYQRTIDFDALWPLKYPTRKNLGSLAKPWSQRGLASLK